MGCPFSVFFLFFFGPFYFDHCVVSSSSNYGL